MISFRAWRHGLAVAGVAAIVAACATDVVSPSKSEGARIQMGVGHFDREGKAFHYWDKQKEIPAVCARCHSANGVPEYLKTGKNSAAPHLKNAFPCATCHSDMLTYARHKVERVTFPSGLGVDSGDNDTNLCMTCHQGRESTANVNKALAGLPSDTPNPKLTYIHVHYFPAGATLYGTQAKVGYEYPGKTYRGKFDHVPGMDTCTSCHEPHGGEVETGKCGACHQGVGNDPKRIRMAGKGDLNGDYREEPLAVELESMKAELMAAIREYALAVGGKPIAFTPDGHPYWYVDTDNNGRIDKEELDPKNGYNAFTPRLMQAVYNASFAIRDPGAAFHNGRYTAQLLYDSLENLGQSGKVKVNMQGKQRP